MQTPHLCKKLARFAFLVGYFGGINFEQSDCLVNPTIPDLDSVPLTAWLC